MSKLTSKPKTTPKSPPRDPQRKRQTGAPPDSTVDKSDEGPDNLRRRDQRETPPDSLPRSSKEEIPVAGHSLAPDGGVAQHPVHDEPEEDFTPRDYERQIDEVADELRAKARRAGVKDTDKVSEER